MTPKQHRLTWHPDAVCFAIGQMRDWIFTAARGERCLYHIGQIAVDQLESDSLRLMAEYAGLMGEFGMVALVQRRIDAGMYQYIAARSHCTARTIPQRVAVGIISVTDYRILRAIMDKEAKTSNINVVRDILSVSTTEAQDVVASMILRGWLSDGRTVTITDKGREMLL